MSASCFSLTLMLLHKGIARNKFLAKVIYLMRQPYAV